ncbi:MAG: M3 family metallopeptidase [Bdellovibrionales bacterium]|nr:M3 family metallopeptidase [Bdellovibrionales bacterium]
MSNDAPNSQQNPLLSPLRAPHEALPFDLLKQEHFLPALEASMQLARGRLDQIRKATDTPTFENTLLALETASEQLDLVVETFFNLLSAEADEAFHALAKDISPRVAAFANEIILDEKIFARIKSLHDRKASLALNQEQSRLLERAYRNFSRNGALLGESAKTRLKEIDIELAKLGPQFSENLLKATYAFEMEITDPSELRGLPESAIEEASAAAKKKGKAASWIFTLEATSFIPFLTYADNRALREKLWRAYQSRATSGEFDNRGVLSDIVRLRHERAQLLGFGTHADYVLEERMAGTHQQVINFLDKMLSAAMPAAQREVADVKAFAKDRDFLMEIMPWDFAYYSEKLKEKRFKFNDEELRPYFVLENVIKGAFEHASKLFGIEFRPAQNIPIYHPDVTVYEVHDKVKNSLVGLFYADFFPRPTKKGGAWMTPLREQGYFGGQIRRPHVSIVCNFTKPLPGKPSLLSFDEVRTLYHEFGHALHGLLSECTYRSIAGTNVYWDFVELPSQLMENWVLEKEVLDTFAFHYQTGEKMPTELMAKVKASATYLAGYQTMRQVSFALLDMAWHASDPRSIGDDVEAFETQIMDRTRVLPKVPGTSASTSFAHIFAGGYSAGYYSYKWAEVLEADAFEYFKERGLYDVEVATKLRREILSRGGTDHPMELYKRFRGREPDPLALLRRDGLIA